MSKFKLFKAFSYLNFIGIVFVSAFTVVWYAEAFGSIVGVIGYRVYWFTSVEFIVNSPIPWEKNHMVIHYNTIIGWLITKILLYLDCFMLCLILNE